MNNFASSDSDETWAMNNSFAEGQATRPWALSPEPGTFADIEYADGYVSMPWLSDGSFGLVDYA